MAKLRKFVHDFFKNTKVDPTDNQSLTGSVIDDSYDARDVALVKSSNSFITNVLRSYKGRGDVNRSVQLIDEILLFRARFKLNDLKEADLHSELVQKGVLFYHGRDKAGHPVLHFQVRKHKKGQLVPEAKQLIAYHLNQHYVTSLEQPLVLLFDMYDAGITNMDLDVTRFTIDCLSTYFPGIGAYNVMFKMGKALEVIWSIIKGWLDAEQSKRTYFASRKNITQYIDADQLLPHMMKNEQAEH